MGKAKDKLAREEAKKAEAQEDFTRLLRHTKSLKLDSTWEDIKPDLETHSAYKDVSLYCTCGFFMVLWQKYGIAWFFTVLCIHVLHLSEKVGMPCVLAVSAKHKGCCVCCVSTFVQGDL